MILPVCGACRCERSTFRVTEEPIAFYLCHCTRCQAESGSAFGQSMYIRATAIDRVDGPITENVSQREDGADTRLTYCTHCLTVLWAARSDVPQMRGLNAGCLADVAGLTPYGNMWTRSARPWVTLAPGPRFEQSPEDPLAMIHAWNDRPRSPGASVEEKRLP